MRLTDAQGEIVRKEVAAVFGPDALIRLFGSRIDDAARGGDIDLHIESDGSPKQLLDRELKPHARLMRKLGERRIDIVVHASDTPLRSIDRHALDTGVAL